MEDSRQPEEPLLEQLCELLSESHASYLETWRIQAGESELALDLRSLLSEGERGHPLGASRTQSVILGAKA